MKELSIEEKAKAYDEAIERAKQLSKELTVDDIVEEIFPELKESEDERVRNKLIEFFKGYYPDEEWWGNITQEDILAWLGKQGDQKPAEWSEKDEKMIDAIYSCVDSHYDGLAKDALLIRLKSLKNRYTWKPSDRQMNVLEYYMHTLACNEHKEILFGLYQDLKKLKE
jgi:hypothetical protein